MTRILHITRNLPPLVGGMERLNWHIADELSRRAQVQMVGPRGAAARKPASVELTEVPLRPLPRFLLASGWKALRLAWRQRPDVVLAGSGLTAPAAWLAARACGARAAAYVHGLDVAVRHPLYRAIWHPILRRMDRVIANSRPTAELVRALGIAEDRIRIVHPGVGLPTAPQPVQALRDFRTRHALGDGPLLLSVGRLTERKGLREFVQRVLPDIAKQYPDARLVVVGDAPEHALRAPVQNVDVIQAEAAASGAAGRICFMGRISDEDLAKLYCAADVHVFPVRQLPGDPEGFGMVAIEAAAHGLPTAAFATGGIVDAVAEGQSGHLVPPGDYAALGQAILRILNDGKPRWQAGTQQFASGFAWPKLGDKLWAALR